MKNIKMIMLLLAGSMFIPNVNAQTFLKRQGKATDVAISKKDGSVYVVGTSKNVFKYNPRTKRFSKFGPQTRDVNRIAISDLNQIFASKINGRVERSNGNASWTTLNAFSNDVATDNLGKLWVSMKDRGGDVQVFDNTWKRPLSTLINVSHVAPIDINTVWAVMDNKSIKKFDDKKWNSMPGAALDIAVDTKTKEVYVIGTSRRIFKWNERQRKWLPLKNTRRDFVSLDAENGKIWATATDKSIYEYTSQSSEQTDQNNKIENYSGTYKVHVKKLVTNYGNREYFGTAGVYLEANTKSGNIKIKPQNNQPNRYLDIPRNNIRKVRKNKTIINGSTYDYSMNIDRTREFKLMGEAANDKATFDFQFNIKMYGPLGVGLFGDFGEWEREKINVKNIRLGEDVIDHSLFYSIIYSITKL